jgi:hypothetical protein
MVSPTQMAAEFSIKTLSLLKRRTAFFLDDHREKAKDSLAKLKHSYGLISKHFFVLKHHSPLWTSKGMQATTISGRSINGQAFPNTGFPQSTTRFYNPKVNMIHKKMYCFEHITRSTLPRDVL